MQVFLYSFLDNEVKVTVPFQITWDIEAQYFGNSNQ